MASSRCASFSQPAIRLQTEPTSPTLESARQSQEIVASENQQKPLSDSAIEKALKAQGITVARRTVAKYREQLNILPSHLRKSYRQDN